MIREGDGYTIQRIGTDGRREYLSEKVEWTAVKKFEGWPSLAYAQRFWRNAGLEEERVYVIGPFGGIYPIKGGRK